MAERRGFGKAPVAPRVPTEAQQTPLREARSSEPVAAPKYEHAGPPSSGVANLQGRIAQRAYEIFQARGCQPGSELQDWLEAERQVRAETGASSGKRGASEKAAAAEGSSNRPAEVRMGEGQKREGKPEAGQPGRDKGAVSVFGDDSMLGRLTDTESFGS